MTKRLQVLLDDDELQEIQRLARRQRLSTAEWVRQSLRRARYAEAGGDTVQKLDVVRQAAQHDFPVGDIADVLAEIERGYLGTDRE